MELLLERLAWMLQEELEGIFTYRRCFSVENVDSLFSRLQTLAI